MLKHAEKLLNEELMTLPCLYIFVSSLFVRDRLLDYVTNQTISAHDHNTRHKNDLSIAQHNTNRFGKGVKYMCIQIYNHLPKKIQTSETRQLIKNNLNMWLLKKSFYSVEDYMCCI